MLFLPPNQQRQSTEGNEFRTYYETVSTQLTSGSSESGTDCVHCSVFLKALDTGRESVSDVACCFITYVSLTTNHCTVLVMVALWNRADHYIFILFLLSSFFLFFSSPNLSGRRLDVYHTLAHGVALVRI